MRYANAMLLSSAMGMMLLPSTAKALGPLQQVYEPTDVASYYQLDANPGAAFSPNDVAMFSRLDFMRASPADEANAALDRFSSVYTANDVEALLQLYAPNAILLGTNSPIISEGRDAVRAYYTNLKLAGSGNKNEIQDRRTIVIDDNTVVVTGFYEFTRISDGKPVPQAARFTALVTKIDGQWLIAHQHSSPRAMAKN